MQVSCITQGLQIIWYLFLLYILTKITHRVIFLHEKPTNEFKEVDKRSSELENVSWFR